MEYIQLPFPRSTKAPKGKAKYCHLCYPCDWPESAAQEQVLRYLENRRRRKAGREKGRYLTSSESVVKVKKQLQNSISTSFLFFFFPKRIRWPYFLSPSCIKAPQNWHYSTTLCSKAIMSPQLKHVDRSPFFPVWWMLRITRTLSYIHHPFTEYRCAGDTVCSAFIPCQWRTRHPAVGSAQLSIEPFGVSPRNYCSCRELPCPRSHHSQGDSHTMTDGCSDVKTGDLGPTKHISEAPFSLQSSPMGWLRLLLDLHFKELSLSPVLLPVPVFHRYLSGGHTLITVLHTKLHHRICSHNTASEMGKYLCLFISSKSIY